MSQQTNNVNKSTKYNSNVENEKLKRKHNDPYGSDEDILDFQERKKNHGKRSKKTEYLMQRTLASQRNEKLLLKRNKESKEILSQEQIDFVGHVIDINNKKEELDKKINDNIFTNEIDDSQNSKVNEDNYTNNNNKKHNVQENNLNFIIDNNLVISHVENFEVFSLDKNKQNKNFEEVLLSFTDCKFELVNEENNNFEYEISIEDNYNKEARFRLKFLTEENTDFVEYTPINIEFEFPEDDFIYQEVDIYKEDLSKFLRKLLNYKYKK